MLIWSSFDEYRKKVNWTLFGLICLFTMGSWIDISGIWCELPLLVNTLPEGWRLPAILTVTSQIAQIGPFLYFTGKLVFPNHFGNVKTIYFIFLIGAISCLLLSFYWDETMIIRNEKRSIYLYIFNFTLSLLDGMSTITFLPYIGEHFIKEYIIANYVGEGLSSLVPGVLGILQFRETVDLEVCPSNSTIDTSNSTLLAEPTIDTSNSTFDSITNQTAPIDLELSKPRFSVSLYFFFMFSLVCLSAVSFSFIHFWDRMRSNRKVGSELNENGLNDKHPRVLISDVTISRKSSSSDSDDTTNEIDNGEKCKISKDKSEIAFLFFLTFIVSFVYYGYLPGIFSYSTMPYGIKYFQLATNISCICLPFSILLSIWSYEVSLRRIFIESLLPLVISGYILATAILSPCPPLADTEYGGYVAVASWVLISCAFMRIRCLIATKLEKYGKNVLFSIGLFTILGQVIGGLLIFTQVEIYRQFIDIPKCVDKQMICPINV